MVPHWANRHGTMLVIVPLQEAADTMPAVAVKPDGSVKEFTVKLGALTDAERQILADGCLINYYKNN